ncbi:MAG TPA: hypothetical protein VMW69_12360 [Spirochaetia bacterium]|nr:hypothetical protein [Spirochaetia bacterium]
MSEKIPLHCVYGKFAVRGETVAGPGRRRVSARAFPGLPADIAEPSWKEDKQLLEMEHFNRLLSPPERS